MASMSSAQLLKDNHGAMLGGTTGLVLAGPLGGLIGSALGHAYDRTRRALLNVEIIHDELAEEPAFTEAPPSRAHEAAFTIGLIALGAKLARLNRRLDRDTIEAFRAAFKLPPSDIPMIRRMFEQALFDAVGHKPYAEQLAQIFVNRPEMLDALLQGLVKFARVDDDGLTPAVLDYLESLTVQFNIPKSRLDDILAGEGLSRADIRPLKVKLTPFDILGVKANAPESVVKQAYRDLLKENHPDRLNYADVSPDVLAAANDKVAELNAAYSAIRKTRGW